jgi:hypothetical protein
LINESKSCGIEGPIPMRADKSAFDKPQRRRHVGF